MKKLFLSFVFVVLTNYIFAEELLIPFSIDNKIGFVDENLHCVLEPQYTGAVVASVSLMVLLECKGYDVLIGKEGELLTRGADKIFIINDNKYFICSSC